MTGSPIRAPGTATDRLRSLLADLVVHTSRSVFRRTPWNFDRANGVETEAAVGEVALGIDVENPDGRCKYEASSLKHVRFAFGRIPEPLANWSFVDIGSGKGRIVLIALGFPFRRVAGVEYAAELHAIAAANLDRYRGPRRAAAVDLVHGDALLTPLPEGDTVVFFYNSFSGNMLEGYLDHLERSVQESPRRLLFLYSNPTERFRLDRRDAFRLVFEGASGYDLTWWGNRRLVVYEVGATRP
jgi:SAM-dependent methyltransferase